MSRRTPTTTTALKGHRITVTLEAPINTELEKNIGKGRRFATKGHAINWCLAKELGVQ